MIEITHSQRVTNTDAYQFLVQVDGLQAKLATANPQVRHELARRCGELIMELVEEKFGGSNNDSE